MTWIFWYFQFDSDFPVDNMSDPKFLSFLERKKLGGKFDLPGEKLTTSVLSTLSPPRSSMSSAERPVSMPRTSTSNLNVHKQSKHAAIKSDCDQCECKATQKGNLKLHKLLIHKGSKFDCDHCDFIAKTIKVWIITNS